MRNELWFILWLVKFWLAKVKNLVKLKFEIKLEGPHTRLGATATCIYAIIPLNTNKKIRFFLRLHAFNKFQTIGSFPTFLHWELVFIFSREKKLSLILEKKGKW